MPGRSRLLMMTMYSTGASPPLSFGYRFAYLKKCFSLNILRGFYTQYAKQQIETTKQNMDAFSCCCFADHIRK